ncbi:hypothetical protein FOPG_12550 [Fusarium oxysporum f. sp. conglutinans race 2 54008]|uniref:Uncharacterized protein n=12 Tax=Fusarium oxysporum species complex TaxID=171631 RepID=A0A0J9V784_FUSO4|nr:hypothetical protein FOXG_19834 [Fusarium oxysporum f. sp. lycopersici 4287]XP_031062081.1 uncharacterized protein FOIG_08070 [Fusarium odoratissimum NRRL 54006]EGU84299.1 hypothetical protein FOXB_05256 [Fusarium oxysporum f. sp. conglutinans Fo5176]EXK32276.1 hypothetical protein FOMG_12529 [Fusarium oxysporum f. sp. melonis 26406]EXL71772.1 hypothetical protein FOPG_12550 [Fusarium oxysporum f. sp. conglutinans race 2 54008]KAH7206114.1 hypothetical protein DER44DRAFT_323499 [Fusarium ox
MASHLRSFAPSLDEIKIDQITESRIFNVVSMLPNSLPGPIRFLRRSISFHTLRPGVTISGPQTKPRPLSEADVSATMAQPLQTDMIKHSGGFVESQDLNPQPMSRVLYSEAPEDEPVMRAASGVHWKFARQGTNLVNISIDGGKAAVAEEDIAFERKAFVDGVTYLLKALPQELDEGELRRIQCALPEQVNQSDMALARAEPDSNRIHPSQSRSIIHRGVQMTVVNLIFFLSFLMPYLLLLVRCAARLERKYKISEKVVGHGVDLVNTIGKQSALLTEAIGQMNDGKVAQALLEVFVWTVDGVTQGISDGLGEGLSMVGSKPKMSG